MNIDQHKFTQAISGFKASFHAAPTDLFIAPGRVEIIGNHTDHQHGRTLSMTIDRYIYIAARKNEELKVVSYNKGYPLAINLDLSDLNVKPEEYGTSMGLIRGIYAYFAKHHYHIGGLDFFSLTTILRGMGLSSSAAFEVAVAKMLNYYYNDNQIDDLEIAKASQFAEQVYFNKPCGLLDQLTISYGGVVYSDFNQASPVIANLDEISENLAFFVINTGKSHAKLTSFYAEITDDLLAVSQAFGKKLLIDVREKDFLERYESLKISLGERPLKRASHIFHENSRVDQAFVAFKKADHLTLKELIRASGISSRNYLCNLTYPGDKDRSLINNFDKIYKNSSYGVRVNGGGFAGTLLVVGDTAEDAKALEKIIRNPKMKIVPVMLAKYKSGHVKAL